MGHETIAGNPNTDWFDSHGEFSSLIQQLQDGSPIADPATATDILTSGLHDNPQLRGFVLESLVSTHNDELLESFFDTGIADDLGRDTQLELLEIAQEDDAGVQIERLVKLITTDIDQTDRSQQDDLPQVTGDGHLHDPRGRALVRDQMRGVSTNPYSGTGDGRPTPSREDLPDDAAQGDKAMLDYLLDRAEQGDIATLARDFSEEPELWDVVRDADEAGVPVLTELANDPTHGPTAIAMLHELGDGVVAELAQTADANPGAAAAVYWLTEGEQLPPEALAEQQADYWISRLSDGDVETRFHARQALRQLGQQAIGPLMDARADSDNRAVVEGLIREMVDGESSPSTESSSSWAPLGSDSGLLTDLDRQPAPTSSSPLYLEPNQLRLSLADPETRLETLGILVEIGRPSVLPLCDIVMSL